MDDNLLERAKLIRQRIQDFEIVPISDAILNSSAEYAQEKLSDALEKFSEVELMGSDDQLEQAALEVDQAYSKCNTYKMFVPGTEVFKKNKELVELYKKLLDDRNQLRKDLKETTEVLSTERGRNLQLAETIKYLEPLIEQAKDFKFFKTNGQGESNGQ